MKYIVQRDPAFDIRDFDVSTAGVVGDNALALFDSRTEAGTRKMKTAPRFWLGAPLPAAKCRPSGAKATAFMTKRMSQD